MSTKYMAGLDLVCGLVYLRVECNCMLLPESISVILMFGDMGSEAHEDRIVKSFCLADRLYMKHFCCLVSNTKEGTHYHKSFAD